MHFLLELCELRPEIHLHLEALGVGERTTSITGTILVTFAGSERL